MSTTNDPYSSGNTTPPAAPTAYGTPAAGGYPAAPGAPTNGGYPNPYGDPAGTPAPGGYPGAYAPAPRWNLLSILSIIAPFVGFSIVGIVLGAIALVQVKRTGERGRGLALTGVIVGSVFTVGSIIFAVLMFIGFLGAVATYGEFGSTFEEGFGSPA